MAVLIDPPRWPAHGTVFAHLVSDTSLEELHALALRAELPPRAFDHDHYDVPASRYDDLVALGATPVGEMDLIRALTASGLRVRKPQKSPTRNESHAIAHRSWSYLGLPETIRDDLLARWQQPHRHYHDVRHLAQVLLALGELACTDRVVILAAWFHDAIYDGAPGRDEEASAALAEDSLAGLLPDDDVAAVGRLIRMTATHSPTDEREAILSDADLSVLGQIPGRYHVYVRDVRLDYAHVDDDAWRNGRSQVLRQLLAKEPLFHTEMARDLWETQARANLEDELRSLTTGLFSGPETRPEP
ncbi:hypothetical protein GCM10025789_08930 [Tessaracoccus lubricantis]|uniref:DUF4031 domain-containing protein n=1 Tax=Tessaracoccus lubricantis TaxID=545543 RepID=A0ABP9F5F5_9ACTN